MLLIVLKQQKFAESAEATTIEQNLPLLSLKCPTGARLNNKSVLQSTAKRFLLYENCRTKLTELPFALSLYYSSLRSSFSSAGGGS